MDFLKEKCKNALKNSFTMKKDVNNILMNIGLKTVDVCFEDLFQHSLQVVSKDPNVTFENYDDKVIDICISSFQHFIEKQTEKIKPMDDITDPLQLACLEAVKNSFTVAGDEDNIIKEIINQSIDHIFHHLYDITKKIVEETTIDESMYETLMIDGCVECFRTALNL